MNKGLLVLVVTNFICVDGDLSYFAKEIMLREQFSFIEDRMKFFHPMFQSESLTLERLIQQEKDCNLHVIFHMDTPARHVSRVMKFISSKIKQEKVIFST